MNTPRILFACDHYIKETFNENLTSTRLYGGKIPDDVSPQWQETYVCRDVLTSPEIIKAEGNIVVTHLKCESCGAPDNREHSENFTFLNTNSVKYVEGYDYDLVSELRSTGQYIYIDWRKDGRHPGDSNSPDSLYYIVNLDYERHFSHQYSGTSIKDLCPRCCGDGWYVGLFEQNMINATLIKEENRLIQSFFKYIYTRKTSTGYGSSMLSLPGKYSTSDEQTVYTLISGEIDNFSAYYKNQTSALMLDGYKFADEEILHSYDIISMNIDKEAHSVNVKIRFYTMAGSKLNVDIILPEEE